MSATWPPDADRSVAPRRTGAVIPAWRGQRPWLLLAVLALAALATEAGLAWREAQLRAAVAVVLAAPAQRAAAPAAPGASAGSGVRPASPAAAASGAASAAAMAPAQSPSGGSGAAQAAEPGLGLAEPPQLRLARALAWAAADDDRALALYHPLQQGRGALAQAARYNAANLLLRQGLALRAGPQPGQAIALIELAKQQYRAVLREHPLDWDARYNLERAQRLLADPDEDEPEPGPGAQPSERAATTMRAFSPGLP